MRKKNMGTQNQDCLSAQLQPGRGRNILNAFSLAIFAKAQFWGNSSTGKVISMA